MRVGSRVGVEMDVVKVADEMLLLIREVVTTLMHLSLICFNATCKSVPVHACIVQFRADVAKTFGLSPSQVPNITAQGKSLFRRITAEEARLSTYS